MSGLFAGFATIDKFDIKARALKAEIDNASTTGDRTKLWDILLYTDGIDVLRQLVNDGYKP